MTSVILDVSQPGVAEWQIEPRDEPLVHAILHHDRRAQFFVSDTYRGPDYEERTRRRRVRDPPRVMPHKDLFVRFSSRAAADKVRANVRREWLFQEVGE
jgi:hypothetical protein